MGYRSRELIGNVRAFFYHNLQRFFCRRQIKVFAWESLGGKAFFPQESPYQNSHLIVICFSCLMEAFTGDIIFGYLISFVIGKLPRRVFHKIS